MACEIKEEQINDVQYVTTQWPATKAMVMKMKLLKMFGDALFEIVSAVTDNSNGKKKDKAETEDGAISEASLEAFQRAIKKIFEQGSPEELVALFKEIICSGNTKRDGTRISESNFDEIYNEAGLGEIYKATLFVIKSNYADFFKGGKVEKFLQKAEQSL